MGLGKLLTRPAAPEPAVQGRAITEFAVIDGKQVFGSEVARSGSYRGAMGLPGCWRAALLLSDLLGSVPWHAFRSRAGSTMQQVDPTPLLLEQPAPPDTRMTTFSSWALDLIWHGNAVGVIAARNAEGWPTAVVPVSAASVGVRRVGPGAQSPLPVGAIEYRIGSLSFGASEVVHIKGPCEPGALRGMGVLEQHLDSLQLGKDQISQARSISQHGVPTGTLKSENPDLTQAEAEQLKAKWLEAQRHRTIAVLNATTSFEALSWNPEELQLVEARKFSLHEQALMIGVPFSFLGVESGSRTYANIEQEGLNLIKFHLGGHLARFEQTLSAHLPRGTQARANLDFVLRADTLSRYQAHQIGLEAGFLTNGEVRQLENREPLPGPEPGETEDEEES